MIKHKQIIYTGIFAAMFMFPAANVLAAGEIDCSTAQTDITRLQNEKASNVERMAKGVTTIMPIGLAVNIARGTAEQNMEIATGDYNKMIDDDIAKIKAACGL